MDKVYLLIPSNITKYPKCPYRDNDQNTPRPTVLEFGRETEEAGKLDCFGIRQEKTGQLSQRESHRHGSSAVTGQIT